MLLPSALGFSPHPPVSVYGTGTAWAIAAFLDSWLTHFATLSSLCITSSGLCGGFANHTPTSLAPVFPFPVCALHLCPHSSAMQQYRNLNLLSIDYVFRPRLRPRLTQGQISFTLETLDIRPGGFPPPSRYSFRHSPFLTVHSPFRYCFIQLTMLPYRFTLSKSHSFGVVFQPRTFSAQDLSTSELLRTL